MKKVLVLLVLVGAGLGVWWFLGRGGGVAPPVGKVLPEAHRPGVTGVQHLDVLGTRALPLLAVMGDQLPIPPEALADPAKRIEALGFDPASAEGWASIGIDAAAGVALTADDRVHAGPSLQGIALLKVLDQGKLLAFIEKRSGVKPTVEAGEPISTLVFGEARMMFGRRGDWTAVLLVPPDEQAALREGFGAFLSDTSPTLAGTRPWREAFRDADDSPQFFAWTGAVAAGAAAAALGLPAEATSTIDFYARFLPAVAAHIGPKHSHLRVLASEDGITLLRQLFAPRKRPPVFSRFLPEK
ncbi:MAG: hypothetical protein KC620_03820, partial [Myxococcales bacterium]|nr:hypothetical protein [Myxococcales bacterium]